MGSLSSVLLNCNVKPLHGQCTPEPMYYIAPVGQEGPTHVDSHAVCSAGCNKDFCFWPRSHVFCQCPRSSNRLIYRLVYRVKPETKVLKYKYWYRIKAGYPNSLTLYFISKEKRKKWKKEEINSERKEMILHILRKRQSMYCKVTVFVFCFFLKNLIFFLIVWVSCPIASWTKVVAYRSWLDTWQKAFILDKIL